MSYQSEYNKVSDTLVTDMSVMERVTTCIVNGKAITVHEKVVPVSVSAHLERELNKAHAEIEKLQEDCNKWKQQWQTVDDERARSFARLAKAVGGCSLTEYQPEIDLEIEAAIKALRANKARLTNALQIAAGSLCVAAINDGVDKIIDAALADKEGGK